MENNKLIAGRCIKSYVDSEHFEEWQLGKRKFTDIQHYEKGDVSPIYRGYNEEYWEEIELEKITMNRSDFMELITELATNITQMNYGAETYAETVVCQETDNERFELMFKEEAQDYFNIIYDEYEDLFNKFNIYPHEERD